MLAAFLRVTSAAILAGIILLLLATVAFPQSCPGGICPSPVSIQPTISKAFEDSPQYEWQCVNDDQFVLKRNGSIVGQWYVPNQSYYVWSGGKNIGPTKPPIDPPTGRSSVAAGKAMADWQISGVNADKINGEELVTFGGRVIHKAKMAEAFEGKLTDDSSKGYFIVVAKDEAKRNAVLSDFLKLPEDFRTRYHLWMADPQHFTMQDRYNGKPRFFTEGDPTVILQNSKGEVIFRRPQAKQVYQQTDMQDLLKSDPNYKPALDPGAPQPVNTFNLDAKTAGYLAAAVVGILAIRRKYNDAQP